MVNDSKISIATIQSTAKTALDASIGASELDQRAWVGVQSVIPNKLANGWTEAIVTIKNTGKTPATKVSMQWIFVYPRSNSANPDIGKSYVPSPTFFDFDERMASMRQEFANWPISDAGVMAPGATWEDPSGNGISDGGGYFLLGEICYNDIFTKIRRVTKFCLRYGNDTRPIVYCDGGNAMN
jgi:hypothetical protein